MDQFDKEAFIAKFKQRQVISKGQGKINAKELRSLLAEVDMDQHQKTINKIVQHLDYYRTGKKSNLTTTSSKIQVKEEPKQEQKDSQSDQQSQELMDRVPEMIVNCEEALKVADLLRNKIKREIWQITARFYGLQYQLLQLGKRTTFPLKDPGHLANINVLVGDQQQNYNSYLRVKFQKKTSKPALGEQVVLRVRIKTNNIEESKLFAGLWQSLYEMISAMVAGELSDGEYFLSTITIKPIENEDSFELQVKSQNPDLNELLQVLSSFPNTVLKTEVKLNLQFQLQFVFDLKQIIQNPKASLYDLLTNSIRIKLLYKGSEYVSAIKQLMIAAQSFKDLSYVNDDSETLNLILLISTHSVDLNLKFKNGEFLNAQQTTLMQVLTIIMEQLRPMISNLQEENGDLHSLIVNAAKKEITVECHAFDYHLNAEVFIKNIDRMLLENAAVLQEQGQQGEKVEKHSNNEGEEGSSNQNKKGPGEADPDSDQDF